MPLTTPTQFPVPEAKTLMKAKKSTIEKIEFIADSIVKNVIADSESFIDRESGITTAAVVSPPTIEAKIKDDRRLHFKMKTPSPPINKMLRET